MGFMAPGRKLLRRSSPETAARDNPDRAAASGGFEDADALARERGAEEAGALAQIGGRPVLEDAAVLDHDDAVERSQGRQAVGDREHRAAAHQLAERALYLDLRLGVERRGRLVEQDD